MEEAVSLISSLGFPIFVALYFMFRMEKTLLNNTKALHELCVVLKNKK